MRSVGRRSLVVAASVAGAVALTATGLVIGSGSSSVNLSGVRSTHQGAKLLAAEANAAFLKALRHDEAPGTAAARPRSATAVSFYNWSGYADTSATKGAFTRVSGSWKVPSITCTTEDQIVALWVGIDGYSDSTVEQTGTSAQCFQGSAFYYSWYEMYPAATQEFGTTVAPGDSISASVVRSGTKYTVALKDSTHTADSGSATATCKATTCLDTSAEWIAERPEYASTGDVPLVSYGTWTLSAGDVTSGSKSGTISSFKPASITMVDSTDTYSLSTPSALTGGNSFKTTWDNSY
jgi:hypothetical protein